MCIDIPSSYIHIQSAVVVILFVAGSWNVSRRYSNERPCPSSCCHCLGSKQPSLYSFPTHTHVWAQTLTPTDTPREHVSNPAEMKLLAFISTTCQIWPARHHCVKRTQYHIDRGVKHISTEGHFNIMAAIKGPVETIRLYKCYYSLTYC